jgi:phosphoglycolate phosphatase-like HAD superfamily hydrolase
MAAALCSRWPVVAIEGFRDREVLEALNPDHIIDRPAELLALL